MTSRFVSDHLEKAADHLLLAVGCVSEAIDPVYVVETPTPRRPSKRQEFNREWERVMFAAHRTFGNCNGREW